MNKFDTERFSRINAKRCKEWEENGPGFTVLETAGAMSGEAGELVNKVKKIRRIELKMRGQDPNDWNKLINEAGLELADVIIYCDLLANVLDLDLWQCVIDKFNKKSVEQGFSHFIGDKEDYERATGKCYDCKGEGKTFEGDYGMVKCIRCKGLGIGELTTSNPDYCKKCGGFGHVLNSLKQQINCDACNTEANVFADKECIDCTGTGKYIGKIVCPKCKGDKRIEVTDHRTKITRDCYTCDSTGMVDSSVKYRGQPKEQEPDGNIHDVDPGDIKRKRSSEGDKYIGKIICLECHGKGKCIICNGIGSRDCNYCNGKGRCKFCNGKCIINPPKKQTHKQYMEIIIQEWKEKEASNNTEPCIFCNGNGWENGDLFNDTNTPCEPCNGSGLIYKIKNNSCQECSGNGYWIIGNQRQTCRGCHGTGKE